MTQPHVQHPCPSLAAAHAALPGPEREALAFHFAGGLAPDEVGELLGLGAPAVVELQVLGLLAVGDALWGTGLHAHVCGAPDCRRALVEHGAGRPGCAPCAGARGAIERTAGAYAAWRSAGPAPCVRAAVLAAVLDTPACEREAVVQR